MNILFDSFSTQVLYQTTPPNLPPGVHDAPIAATGRRLNTLLGAVAGVGVSSGNRWTVSYSAYPITPAQLDGINVYVSFTRFPASPFAYAASELSALQDWVSAGGGLLLATDHGPFQNISTSWPANDIALAAAFGITLQAYGVSSNDWMQMSLGSLTPPFIANQVGGIVAHDSCIIDNPGGTYTCLASFPPSALMWDPNANPPANVPPLASNFAVHVPWQKGNVIVLGNSGMFADYGTSQPSCGLAPMQQNLLFFLNCAGYLGGLTTVPPIGMCP